MPTYDYLCPNNHAHEHFCSISARPETRQCPECGETAKSAILSAPSLATHIVLDYPGSKKHKAGYQHSHADRKGNNIQVGYGGKITPRDAPPATDGAIWHNPLA
jgi:putative FmdB family regulatory protein